MDGVLKSITDPINKALAPLYDLINKAFEYNKFLAGGALATFITVALFFLMVALISLGDTGIKTDNSRKLADVIMPERDIDTLFDDFEKGKITPEDFISSFKESENLKIKEIDFITNELFDFDQHYESLGLGDSVNAETREAIINEGAKFCEQVLAPLHQSGDEERPRGPGEGHVHLLEQEGRALEDQKLARERRGLLTPRRDG